MPLDEMKVSNMAAASLEPRLEVISPEKDEIEEFKSEIFNIPTELDPLLIVLQECGETLAKIEQSDLGQEGKSQFRKEMQALAEELQRELKVKCDIALKKPEVVSAPAAIPYPRVVPELVVVSAPPAIDKDVHQKFIDLAMLRIRIQDEILDLVANNELEGCSNKSRAFSKAIPNNFCSPLIRVQDLKKFYYNLCGGNAAINNDRNLKRAIVKLDLMLLELNVLQNELRRKWYHHEEKMYSYNEILDSALKKLQDQQEVKQEVYIRTYKRDRCFQEYQELEKKDKSRSISSISLSLKQLKLGSLEKELREVSELYPEKPCSEAFKKAKEAVEAYVYIDLKSTAQEKYQSVHKFLLELELKTDPKEKRDYLAKFLDAQAKKPMKDKTSIDYYRSYSFFQYKEVRGITETRRLLKTLLEVLTEESAEALGEEKEPKEPQIRFQRL